MKDSLNKAIALHKVHMKKPKSATMKSQEEMMTLMKKHKKEMKPSSKAKRRG